MLTLKNGFVKRNQYALNLLTRLSDCLIISGSFWHLILDRRLVWSATEVCLLIGGLFLYRALISIADLQQSWRSESLFRELTRLCGVWLVLSCIGIAGAAVFLPRLPSEALLAWLAIAGTGLGCWRIIVRLGLQLLRRHGFNSRSVVIAGAGMLGRTLAHTLHQSPWMGLALRGFYDDNPEVQAHLNSNQYQGSLDQLILDAKQGGIDRIYLAMPTRAQARIQQVVDALADSTVSVYLVPDLFVFDLLHSRFVDHGGIPALSIYESPMQGVNASLKRLEDVLLSSLILCLIALPMLAIALGIKLSSRGPVLFKQQRYGIDGKAINVWKFRSMSVCENGGSIRQATRHDSRITPFGGFLRRTSLDELPQFINVLQGSMSIVGPRPHAIAHNEEYRKLINGYMLRHKVKPGITGWAQVNGWRGETDTLEKMERRIDFDLDYIRTWSISLDLKIILMTLYRGFVGRNAY